MAGKGEKWCPICTEEMDLTDQQLKPCKCGYEICVWCWHHITEMAAKDGTEGQCPACRTAYDKERIVAMATSCQRLVAEMNSQRKKKMQKLKPKASEGKKHLSDTRVIQRNLVYIIGLPLNLADEHLLQRREYFGRYGKVLKLSISRTPTGLIQHSANNSCCVYITYSKEAEAVQCIQSVHCFVLDGRFLRACFGTTKYCHAWLRNVPCSNRDCLYLHDYGSQEDSFTKDELVLAFARSRVEQIIGATNNLHRRSGNVLPSPTDDPRHMSLATKPVARNPLDKIENQNKEFCSSGSTGNSTALPAVSSWAMRVSGSLQMDTNLSCSGNPPNKKVEASNDPQALVSGGASIERSTLDTRGSGETGNSSEVDSNGVLVPLESTQHYIDENSQTRESNVLKKVIVKKLPTTLLADHETPLAACMGNDQEIVAPSASTSFLKVSKPHHDFNVDKAVSHNSIEDVQGLCYGLSSNSIGSHIEDRCSTPNSDSLHLTYNSTDSSRTHSLQQGNKYSVQHSTSPASWEDSLNFDSEQPKCSKGSYNVSTGLCSPCLPQNVDHSSQHLWQQGQIFHPNHSGPGQPYGYFNEPLERGFGEHVESQGSITGIKNKVDADMGETSIISSILSLELDSWDDSLALPQSLVKLLGESDEQCRSLKAHTWLKVQDKNQSRFSFARQDEFLNEASDSEHSFGITMHDPRKYLASGSLMQKEDTSTGISWHFLPSNNFVESDILVSSQSFTPSELSVSNVSASTRPGISLSSRVPPGFSCVKAEQDYNNSVQQLQQQYVSPLGNIGSIGNVQFIDHAILEVGKGMLAGRQNDASLDMRQTLFPQFSPGEDDARLKLLLEESLSAQNLRFPDSIGNRFAPQNDDAYRISLGIPDHFHPNNPPVYGLLHSQQFGTDMLTSNSQWDGRNHGKNFNGLAMSEVLNSERLGFNNCRSSYENVKF